MTDEKRIGLGVILYMFNQDLSKVLLLKLNKQKRFKYNADWGNVGGKIKIGETSLEGCIRESEEEIGIRFQPKKLKLLYIKEIPNFFNTFHAIQFVYGTKFGEQTPINLGKEIESYKWFKLYKLPERTLDSKKTYYEAKNKLKKEDYSYTKVN